ncbi:hypothetical protein [Marinilabilia salmonicolor]|uniref:Uncharacterized protein n=1 Tax=Marinilabilia salmonicolor TaxID=989 RepID=A0A368UIX7_9BACT|nr:hypothetical protein [Marinilabilia salmonicolor]RCW21178.1 hypothetical protein DFO77_1561 [Marinilabilia salmonicolor]
MEENTNKSANYALLEERLKRLDRKDFDWSAWKRGTLLVLEKIFGKESLYLKELESTDYHYNSWSLRDTAGSEDPVKASVRELLNICLTDAEHQKQHLPSNQTNVKSDQLKEIINQFLNNATLSEIKNIATSDAPEISKEEQIQKIISDKIPRYQTALLGKILLWASQ